MFKLGWGRLKKFLGQIIITGDEECWEWQGPTNPDGYGVVGFKGLPNLVHRLAWMINEACDIPEGMLVLHKCDNPCCVNPVHLFLGTQADNAKDCSAKGRSSSLKGSMNGNSKLTEDIVRQIKKAIAEGEKRRIIAHRFGVSPPTIDRIKFGESWGHVKGDVLDVIEDEEEDEPPARGRGKVSRR